MGEFARGLRITTDDIESVESACGRFRDAFAALRSEVGNVVVGQGSVVDRGVVLASLLVATYPSTFS